MTDERFDERDLRLVDAVLALLPDDGPVPDAHELAALAEGLLDDPQLVGRLAGSSRALDLLAAALEEHRANVARHAGARGGGARDTGLQDTGVRNAGAQRDAAAQDADAAEQAAARRAALVAGARGLVASAAPVTASAPRAQTVTPFATGGPTSDADRSLAHRRAGAGALAVAAALLLGITLSSPPRPLAGLADGTPLAVRVMRDAPPAGSAREAETQGLAAYAAGEYASARDAFRLALARGGRPELLVLEASAARLSGERDPARLASLADGLLSLTAGATPSVAAQALWERVQLQLALGNRAAARVGLDRLLGGLPGGEPPAALRDRALALRAALAR